MMNEVVYQCRTCKQSEWYQAEEINMHLSDVHGISPYDRCTRSMVLHLEEDRCDRMIYSHVFDNGTKVIADVTCKHREADPMGGFLETRRPVEREEPVFSNLLPVSKVLYNPN
jgi:hypothetical protein